jgi:hypothetical protein
MKSKLLLALASLIIGLASFGANSAYADMMSVPDQTQSKFCTNEGWNVIDTGCLGNITDDREGKAAYGEPREEKMETTGEHGRFCANELNLFETNCDPSK